MENPIAEWKIYLDAESGDLLEKFNLIKEVNEKGRVFDPNPLVVLNDATLKDTSQYRQVILRGLTGNGMLDGQFVSTRNTPNRIGKSDLQFLFKRPDRAFK